jgi:hypothetical protein
MYKYNLIFWFSLKPDDSNGHVEADVDMCDEFNWGVIRLIRTKIDR